jgi:hypothetical protein
MFSVHQPWDPLKVCVVGRSYPPEFYNFIENPRLRDLFQRIARETEEDFQLLIQTLEKFNVEVIRPNIPEVQVDEYLTTNNRIPGPISMTPRDQMIMIGDNFFMFPYEYISTKASGLRRLVNPGSPRPNNIIPTNWTEVTYNNLKGPSWPQEFTEFYNLPQWIQDECINQFGFKYTPEENLAELADNTAKYEWWKPIADCVKKAGNPIIENQYHDILNRIPPNGITRIGKDLYFGISADTAGSQDMQDLIDKFFKDYRCHLVTTGGHIDGCFTPVKPGLIISIEEIKTYAETFPGWEVVYLEGESWNKMQEFTDLKKKNAGRWWIKGSEYDDELIDYVETWLADWVGYAEETVFDVNILVIDQQNIIVSGYNKKAFDAFERHGITAHICPLRHRYFWDGGVHCVTLDLDREGTKQKFF